MKKLFVLLLLALPPAGSFGQPPDINAIVGSYVGDVYNGDDLDPITTVFRIGSEGWLTGEYSVEAEQGEYKGTVSNILLEDATTITGEWTDQFGEGYMQLQFSRDFQRFTGFWSVYDSDQQLPWNGVKQ